MKSKITLYYKSLVNKEKNFVLDKLDGSSSLTTYLSTLQSESINNFQYVKQGLSVSIKLNKSQVALEMVDSKDLNYVRIQNFDVVNEVEVREKPYFYFVISKTWRSKETIELVLSMDTLNTFRFNHDYLINEKTLTKRMHKDRFEIRSNEKTIPCDDIECVGSGAGFNSGDQVEVFPDLTKKDIESLNFGRYSCSPTLIYDSTAGTDIPLSLIDDIQYGLSWDESGNDSSLYGWIECTFTNPDIDISGHTIYFSFDLIIDDRRFVRKIDLKSEDIASPTYKTSERVLYGNNGDNLENWVLYYKNRNTQDNSPIDCYLMADRVQEMTFAGTNYVSINNIPLNKYLLFTRWYETENFQVEFDDKIIKVYNDTTLGMSYYHCFALWNDNGALKVVQLKYVYKGLPNRASLEEEVVYTPTNPNQVRINISKTSVACREMNDISGPWTGGTASYPFYKSRANYTLVLGATTTATLNSSNDIDKTLQENIKIINIPYCPSQLTKDGDTYTLDPIWTYDSTYKFFRLVDFNTPFTNDIVTDVDDVLNNFNVDISVNTNATRTLKDSKLFHSDYFRPKFVYDSFSKVFALEHIDYGESLKEYSGVFKFTFVMTRNIVSKFLFKFNYVYNHSNEDYENIVAVARNNEEVLYNSSYLNYIRTGYNYDLKAKERQEVTSGVGIGLSILGLVASGVIGVATGNPLAIGSAVASGIGLATSLVNFAKTSAQNEENIQRKLQETQRQAVSVLNADDYDLLRSYAGNKAKLCYYKVSNQMERILDDLFYYAGYVVNEQMIPTINSRYWFNFVQATLVINDSSNLTSEIEDDIKEKFEQGVTFLHYHNKFDFNQEMENWETSLLE